MIRHVLCDIGNVLLFFDLQRAVRRLIPGEQMPHPEAEAVIIRHRDPMERGETSPEAFLDGIMRDLAFQGSKEDARAAYADIFTPNPPMWERVRRWKKDGLHLVLFSNISALHADFIQERYEGFDIFDDAIFSFRTGDLKPGPGMYREAVDRLGMRPEETFFVDDRPENVQAGADHGFHAHQYHPDADAAVDEMFAQAHRHP